MTKLPLAVAFFVTTAAMVFVGVATALIWVGIGVLIAAMFTWRAFARAERALVRSMLRVDIASPYVAIPREFSRLERARAMAADPATWKDLLYVPVDLVLSVVWFALTVALWPTGLALFLVRGFAHAHAAVARALLGPSSRAQLEARNRALVERRRRAVDAATDERRRIERDLHDGTQQRLVALALDLGMAREKFGTEPGAARALVEQAHAEAKRALAELRDLVRGIHPAVLTDRGLDAALSALAGRSPVPVEIDVRLSRRLDPALEAIAYFATAESLTNVAKYASASRAWVLVEEGERHLVVEIRDNGGGGARVRPHGGLAGLADRAAGVDGSLHVDSPEGGPTVVRLELPVPA